MLLFIFDDHRLKDSFAPAIEHDIEILRRFILAQDNISVVESFDFQRLGKNHERVIRDIGEYHLILKRLHLVFQVSHFSEIVNENLLEYILINGNDIAVRLG